MNIRRIIKEEINKSDKDIIGKELWFEYHCWESPESCDAELWYRSHQKVTVLNRGIDDHDEYTEEPKVYDVVFKDGFKGTVFADELMNSPKEFYRPNPPNINESDGLQWIKDTKSNQDIAQEIADETKIKNDLLHPPFTLSHPFLSPVSIPLSSLPLFLSHFSSFPLLSSSFTKYGKEQYGLNKEDANDVWERYKKLIKNKVNNLNESNDFSWIDEIPQYDFHNGKYYIDISGLDEDEACEVQQAILNIGIDWKDSMGLQKRFCDSNTTKGYIIKNGTLYRTPRTFKEYEEAIYPDVIYIDGRTDLLS